MNKRCAYRPSAAYGTQPLILALKGVTHVFSCRVILIYLCRVIKKNSSYDTGHERKDTVLHGSDNDCLRRRPRLYMLLPEPLQD